MPIYDITIPVRDEMAVWPGDTPFRFTETMRIRDGASVNLGQFVTTIHVGTHADAPRHFLADGGDLETIPIETYVGESLVVDVSARDIIRIADLVDLAAQSNSALPPRVLFKTDAWLDATRFPESVPVMEPGLPDWLGAQGVRLVGLDIPSVDALDSKDLPNHHALYRNGIAILESLRLANVPSGRYELIALPMRLTGTDGAPVRAILRELT